MKFQLHYPAKPYKLNQAWGTNKKIRAPFDGVCIKIGYQPNGGGNFLGFISKNYYEFGDGKVCQVLLDFLHCESISVKGGQDCEEGDELAIGDNTGFSTGTHTHIQPRRVSWDGISIQTIDKNDANNSFDIVPYFTGDYAEDIWKLKQSILTLTIEFLKLKVALLLKQIK